MSSQVDLDAQLRRQASEMSNVALFEQRTGLDTLLHDLERRIDQKERVHSQLRAEGQQGVKGYSAQRLNALEEEIMGMRAEFRVVKRRLWFVSEEVKARQVMGRSPANDPRTPSLQEQEAFKQKLKEDREKGDRVAVKQFPTPQLVSMRNDLAHSKDFITSSRERLRMEVTRIKRIKNFNTNPDLFADYNRMMADLERFDGQMEEVSSRYRAVNLELSLRNWSANRP